MSTSSRHRSRKCQGGVNGYRRVAHCHQRKLLWLHACTAFQGGLGACSHQKIDLFLCALRLILVQSKPKIMILNVVFRILERRGVCTPIATPIPPSQPPPLPYQPLPAAASLKLVIHQVQLINCKLIQSITKLPKITSCGIRYTSYTLRLAS